MSLSIPSLCGWLLNKKAAMVEVSLAFLHWVGIALQSPHLTVHLWHSHYLCSKGTLNSQLTNLMLSLCDLPDLPLHHPGIVLSNMSFFDDFSSSCYKFSLYFSFFLDLFQQVPLYSSPLQYPLIGYSSYP